MGTTRESKWKGQKMSIYFGNDNPKKISSYERDYGPETRILDAYQQCACRPASPASILPTSDRDPKLQFLTSTRQFFDNYNKNISHEIFKRCVGESDSTKEFHTKVSCVMKFNEQLPPLTKSALDYRATRIAVPPATPFLINAVKRSPRFSKYFVKEVGEKCPTVTEAMHAFQWPDGGKLTQDVVRRDPRVDRW